MSELLTFVHLLAIMSFELEPVIEFISKQRLLILSQYVNSCFKVNKQLTCNTGDIWVLAFTVLWSKCSFLNLHVTLKQKFKLHGNRNLWLHQVHHFTMIFKNNTPMQKKMKNKACSVL